MSIIEVKVPQLSESVSEGTLTAWKKKIGESIARDEIVIDIETDKVVLEVPVTEAGVLIEIVKGDGETVVSGEVIARIDTSAQAAAPAPAATAAPVAAAAPAAAAPVSAASPAARKILDEKGVATSDVAGTGRGGRVTKEDAVSAQPKAAAVAAPAVATIPLGERSEQRVPMTRLRARIAERLLQSKNENAILTTFNEVNMAPIMALRKQYGEKFEKTHGVRLGFMGFFVKAACAALEKFPILNASVDGNDIVYHGYIDIGIAVGSPRGLVVPILRNASEMSIADIEKKIAEYGVKAKDGKITME
ncbi:MAG: hypothetical protein RIR18_13, partial [Pseudomonadota bacterium]